MNEQRSEATSHAEGIQREIRELLDFVASRKERRDEVIGRSTALGPAAAASLCEALEDVRVEARKAAAEALCRIGDGRALGPLLGLLCGRSDWASHHLGILYKKEFLDIPGAREAVLRVLRDDPPEHANLIIHAVRGDPGDEEARDSFPAVFSNSGLPHVARNAALEALCSLESTMPTELVQEALADDTFRCHSGSAWWIAVREGLRLPIQVCLRGFDRSVPAASRRLAGTLVLRHGEEGGGVLREVMSSGSVDERATAALALVPEGGPDVFGVLTDELLRGHRPHSRNCSVDFHARALCRGSRSGQPCLGESPGDSGGTLRSPNGSSRPCRRPPSHRFVRVVRAQYRSSKHLAWCEPRTTTKEYPS